MLKIVSYESPLPVWAGLIGLFAFARLLSQRYHNGLHRYSGPFWASFTDLWRLCHSYRNSYREPMVHMHEKYGDVVRMGPNVLSFGQPQAIKDIYGPGKQFKKSGYYPVNAAVSKGHMAHTLFSSPDEVWHRQLRKSISAAFTVGAAASYEYLVDNTVRVYLDDLGKRYSARPGPEGVIDLHTSLLYFAFDVIGDLTYGSRYGFIESGKDVNGIIHYVVSFLNYGFIAGQMPLIDLLFRHNPVLMWLERRGWYQGSTFPGVPIALQRLRERQRRYDAGLSKGGAEIREDLLDQFLKARQENPSVLTEQEVLGLSLSMMIAGSETTAITLTAFFYYLLRTPGCYAKLQHELDTSLPGISSTEIFCNTRYAEARALPYLHACIQETFRMHPAFGFNYERIVPPSGTMICGTFVPGGTIVGVNPWVVQRDRGVYGHDAHTYRPERWLESSADKVQEMARTLFQFGAGEHICLGKNISILEMYKLVPSFMRTFHIELENADKEWSIFNGANVRMSGVNIRIKRR